MLLLHANHDNDKRSPIINDSINMYEYSLSLKIPLSYLQCEII